MMLNACQYWTTIGHAVMYVCMYVAAGSDAECLLPGPTGCLYPPLLYLLSGELWSDTGGPAVDRP